MSCSEPFSIAFLPRDSGPYFSSGFLLIFVLALELFGIARGIKKIDHFSHLGGYMAGIVGAEGINHAARQRRLEPHGPGLMNWRKSIPANKTKE